MCLPSQTTVLAGFALERRPLEKTGVSGHPCKGCHSYGVVVMTQAFTFLRRLPNVCFDYAQWLKTTASCWNEITSLSTRFVTFAWFGRFFFSPSPLTPFYFSSFNYPSSSFCSFFDCPPLLLMNISVPTITLPCSFIHRAWLPCLTIPALKCLRLTLSWNSCKSITTL